MSSEFCQTKGKFEWRLENGEKQLRKVQSQVDILSYRQGRVEKDVSEVAKNAETISFSLHLLSVKVESIAAGQWEIVKRIHLHSVYLLINEARTSICFAHVFQCVEEIRKNNIVISCAAFFLGIQAIIRNAQPRMLANDPQNNVLPPEALNGEGNAPQAPLLEEEAHIEEGSDDCASEQDAPAETGFLSSFRDLLYSAAEILAFFFSLGMYKKSFTGESSASAFEKLKKFGKHLYKTGKCFSVKFLSGNSCVSIQSEVNIQINRFS